jgi:hypothetical protein
MPPFYFFYLLSTIFPEEPKKLNNDKDFPVDEYKNVLDYQLELINNKDIYEHEMPD